MKKTQFIELIKNIKSTLVPFISITLFVALGVGIFVGISWTSNALVESIDENLIETNFHDIQIIFPSGMDSNDVNELIKIEGISEVECSYTAYTYFKMNDIEYQAKLIQLHDNIDLPFNIEGTLPTKYNEVVLDKAFANNNNIKIGDNIYFVADNDGSSRSLVSIINFDEETNNVEDLNFSSEQKMAYLKTDCFKVTALANSSEFLSRNKNNYGISLVNKLAVDCFAYLPKSAFDENSFAGYTEVLVRSNELRKYSIADVEYTTKVSDLADRINDQLLNHLLNDKNTAMHNAIDNYGFISESKLNDAKEEIDKAEKTINKAKNDIINGKKILDDSLLELQEAEENLANAKDEYEEKARQFSKINEYSNSISKLRNITSSDITLNRDEILSQIYQLADEAEQKGYDVIASMLNQVASYIESYNYEEAIEYLQQLFAYLDSFQAELSNAKHLIEEAEEKIEAGHFEYDNGLKQLEIKQKELNNAISKLEEAKLKYDDSINKYQLYKDKTLNIGDFGCTILTRKFNAGLVIIDSLNGSFVNIRYSMALLFIVVCLLVCYSSLSRIVSDQVVLIGTKKALGISNRAIYCFYLTYTLIAVIVGCAVGGFLGYFGVEKVFVESIGADFWNQFHLYFSLKDFVSICILHLALLVSVTFLACKRVLNRSAVSLLRDEEANNNKQRFYESTKLWQKLSLLNKTIINNFINDKQRVFGTIVGIAGATALIVTALTLNDNILDSFKMMYDDYYHFDSIIYYDSDNIEAKNKLENYFKNNNIPCSNIFFTRMYNVTPSNEYVMSYLFIPGGSNGFDGLINIKSIDNKHEDTDNGYWMCRAYSNYFHPLKDDPITLINYNGIKKNIVPNGYFDYYLVNYQNFMDKQTYIDNYDEEPIPNAFLINCNGKDLKDITKNLENIDGYVTYADFYNTTHEAFETFAKVSRILVAVYISLAIVMYFLVVLNLMTMFIMEKKKELIVMMVNGYSIKQAKKYIYADTIFLSIIGIAVGLLIGILMGSIAISSFETSVTVFLHRLDLKACLIGIVISSFMIYSISIISLRKINRFTLTDINEL